MPDEIKTPKEELLIKFREHHDHLLKQKEIAYNSFQQLLGAIQVSDSLIKRVDECSFEKKDDSEGYGISLI